MGIKLNYEIVFAFFKSKGLTITDDKYIKSSIKMNCIDSQGYKVLISYSNLKIGKTPSRFGNGNPYTIENIHHYIKLNRENVELISTEFISSGKDNLLFKCLIHNKVFPQSWHHFREGSGCPKCATERAVKSTSFTFEYVNECILEVKPKHIEFLSEEYKSCVDLLKFKCLKHNVDFERSLVNFNKSSSCPMCTSENISGVNNHNWKGGISNLSTYLRNSILVWRLTSFEKYNWTCDITGIKSKGNEIHHLHSFSSILKETINILNLPIYQEINKYTSEELDSVENTCINLHCKYGLGVCLSNEIHKELHLYYGGTHVEINEQDYYNFKEYYLDKISKQNN